MRSARGVTAIRPALGRGFTIRRSVTVANCGSAVRSLTPARASIPGTFGTVRASGSLPHDDPSFYVGIIHSGNTSPKRTTNAAWRRCPNAEIEALLGDDVSFDGSHAVSSSRVR